ncbi:MAG TPA: hypothetical protein PK082_00640 [Phycisphaerae bacterium]|nr:hypothetical protein [Phycisphaerae bacterium]
MKRKTLTTMKAAEIGRKMGVRGLCIYRDDIDRNLWRVITPGRSEVHQPMDEKAWRAFLRASGWIERRARYDAGNGRKVTVPENDERDLFDALRERLSVKALVAIAAHLHGTVRTADDKVNDEVAAFAEGLLERLGDRYSTLLDEIGL